MVAAPQLNRCPECGGMTFNTYCHAHAPKYALALIKQRQRLDAPRKYVRRERLSDGRVRCPECDADIRTEADCERCDGRGWITPEPPARD